MMHRKRACISLLAIATLTGAASAQDSRPTPTTVAIEDPNIKQAVSAAAVRYGRLVLIGTQAGRRYSLPTSVYTNQGGTRMTVLEGRLAQLAAISPGQLAQGPGAATIQVESFTIGGDGTLRAITGPDKTSSIPDGTYTSQDGTKSLTIRQGRPTHFILPYVAERTTTTENQPSPLTAPVRR